MPSGIITPLCPWKPLHPLLGFCQTEALQVALEATIEHLTLSVGLRMVSRAHLQLGALQFEEVLPKMIYEDNISIRDNGLKHTVMLEDVINKHLNTEPAVYGCFKGMKWVA